MEVNTCVESVDVIFHQTMNSTITRVTAGHEVIRQIEYMRKKMGSRQNMPPWKAT